MSRAIAAARPSTESAVAAGQLPTRQSRKPRRPKLIDAPRQSKPCQHVDQRQLSLRSAASSHPDCRAVLIQIVAQYGTLAYAQRYVPSGLSAIILATIPFWIVLVNASTGQSEPLRKFLAFVPGLAGVGVIAWNETSNAQH